MSSDIDFQNGFLCGMATKGLVRSGELYKPIVWNDSGVFSYFYIDFRRAMRAFSVGMMYESIIVADTAQLAPTAVERVSNTVYKITVDLSQCIHGVTVLNKATSLLHFTNGERLPVFSVSFYLEGMTSYMRTDYAYDHCTMTDGWNPEIVETPYELELPGAFSMDEISENITDDFWSPSSTNETTVSVVLK